MRLCSLGLITVLSVLGLAQIAQPNTNRPTVTPPVCRLSAAEATKHIGETAVVTGLVAQVSVREKVAYLNLDKPYPESPFSGVIFGRVTNKFGDLSRLEGRPVEIRGKIEEYRGKPQIVLNSTNQLTTVPKE